MIRSESFDRSKRMRTVNQANQTTCDHSTDQIYEQSNKPSINLFTYQFLLPLLLDYLTDSDVLARLVVSHRSIASSIKRSLHCYDVKRLLPIATARMIVQMRSINQSIDLPLAFIRIKGLSSDDAHLINTIKWSRRADHEFHFTFIDGLNRPNLVAGSLLITHHHASHVRSINQLTSSDNRNPKLRTLQLTCPSSSSSCEVTHLTFYNTTCDHALIYSPLEPGAIPESVVDIDFGNVSYALIAGSLPSSLTRLKLGVAAARLDFGILPTSLTSLDLGEYAGDLKVGVIPESVIQLKLRGMSSGNIEIGALSHVTHLDLDCNFNQPLPQGLIPSSVTHLELGHRFEQVLDIGSIPESVTSLKLGRNFQMCLQPAGVFPNTITRLVVDFPLSRLQGHFSPRHLTHLAQTMPTQCIIFSPIIGTSLTHIHLSQPIMSQVLPHGVTHLTLSGDNMHTNCIPDSVTHLALSGYSSRLTPFITIPDSVTYLLLDLDITSAEQFPLLSNSLTHLVFGNLFNSLEIKSGMIPSSVTHLAFSDTYHYPINSDAIPPSTTHLYLGRNFSKLFALHESPSSIAPLFAMPPISARMSVSAIPPSITHLAVPDCFAYLSDEWQAPATITHLTFGQPDWLINHKQSMEWHETSGSNCSRFGRSGKTI